MNDGLDLIMVGKGTYTAVEMPDEDDQLPTGLFFVERLESHLLAMLVFDEELAHFFQGAGVGECVVRCSFLLSSCVAILRWC